MLSELAEQMPKAVQHIIMSFLKANPRMVVQRLNL